MPLKQIRSPKAFSLVEVIVGVVLVTIISTASWMVVSVLTKSTETSRNKAAATNYLQYSQEEVRNSAQAKGVFDALAACQFPNSPADPATICGFKDVSDQFPGFQRTLSVTNEGGSPELKRIVITVNWVEMGAAKEMDSVILLSRPPDPLPGNLIGTVTDADTGNLISGVQVRLTLAASSHQTLSLNALTAKGANYDFVDPATLQFVVQPGSWKLTATHPSYEDILPESINIASDTESRFDFTMTALPADATISGKLISRITGLPIAVPTSLIRLYENGALQFNAAQPNYNFTIQFTTPAEKCFTVNTFNAYLGGYAYPVGAAGAPSCNFQYSAPGYSTAVVRDDLGTLNCANPYNGAAGAPPTDPDRICVEPGENLIQDLALDPIPEVIVTGKVVNQLNEPINNAIVYASWPANLGRPTWLRTTRSLPDGTFSLAVPAAQALFPDGPPATHHLSVIANGPVAVKICCDVVRVENRDSNRVFIPEALFEGTSPAPVTLVITNADSTCGNLQGNFMDAKTGGLINGAVVRVASNNELTNNSAYIFQCPAAGSRLVVGNHIVQVTHPNYYTYDSRGNAWYSPKPSAGILPNQMSNYDGKLWPIGRGNIIGTIRDGATANPVANADVTLTLYDGTVLTFRTAADGTFAFNGVLETWPAPPLAADPYFNPNPQPRPKIVVDHPGGIYGAETRFVDELQNGETVIVDIPLFPEGAF